MSECTCVPIDGRHMLRCGVFEIQALKPKDAPGTFKRERHERAAEETATEKANKVAAKKRDGHKCRWPHRCHKADRIESAHIVDKSLGGSDDTSNLITVCLSIHQGPGSIHAKGKKVEPTSALGADGLCAFYQKNAITGEWDHIATETAINVSETRR